MMIFFDRRFLSIYVLVGLFVCNSVIAIVPAPPKIKASSYLIVDYESGRYLVEENIDERLEPASLTKMMTAYIISSELVANNISMSDMVKISEGAWRMSGSRMFVEVDKEVSVEELLKGIIVQSGNDASVALAEHISGSEEVFAQVMNQYASDLGMTGTHFVNSTGLPDEGHYTTARDMGILARALIRNHPEIYAWHSIKDFTFNGIKQHNRNQMLWRDESVDGIKTGHTESAGYCLVASAKRDGMRLISVVMGTEGTKARTQATQSLLTYSFRFYETHKLYQGGKAITSSKIWKGNTDSFDVGIAEDLYVTIARGKYKQLDAAIEIKPVIVAPIGEAEVQGDLKITLEGEEVANRPLISLQAVGQGSFLNRLRDDIKLLFE
ncbi:MAG: D-alanyl-D-alanine carboxypeptidase (penicillin-binding protein 5/6) [Planctomycetota bacterium]|jgi:D-alanyl-D-alanine carboxypeptidase (penicillin-binding protein 5/6)